MSTHIVHITQHGSILGKKDGFITCKSPGAAEKTLPHGDVRAVIIAARGVTLTSSFLSILTDSDAIILHCNETYQPCGLTTPLSRVVDLAVFNNQNSGPPRLKTRLWQSMLRGKTSNQVAVLKARSVTSPFHERALQTGAINEAECAKKYWGLFFPSIGWGDTRRNQQDKNPPNMMLNYGYAVLAALCHRSLIVHGLNPSLGVYHKPRFRSHPLVYDVMEPLRPFVDYALADYHSQSDNTLEGWCRHIGGCLRDVRVKRRDLTLKLVDAIDVSASTLARSFGTKNALEYWWPSIPSAE